MAEVRKYFCCTDNLTGCKIIGGVGIALNKIWLIISLMIMVMMIMRWGYVQTMPIYAVIIFGLKSLSYIFLIIAARKRNATLLMVFIILIGLDILLSLYGVAIVFIAQSLVSIGRVWAQRRARAREEVKSYANIA